MILGGTARFTELGYPASKIEHVYAPTQELYERARSLRQEILAFRAGGFPNMGDIWFLLVKMTEGVDGPLGHLCEQLLVNRRLSGKVKTWAIEIEKAEANRLDAQSPWMKRLTAAATLPYYMQNKETSPRAEAIKLLLELYEPARELFDRCAWLLEKNDKLNLELPHAIVDSTQTARKVLEDFISFGALSEEATRVRDDCRRLELLGEEIGVSKFELKFKVASLALSVTDEKKLKAAAEALR